MNPCAMVVPKDRSGPFRSVDHTGDHRCVGNEPTSSWVTVAPSRLCPTFSPAAAARSGSKVRMGLWSAVSIGVVCGRCAAQEPAVTRCVNRPVSGRR